MDRRDAMRVDRQKLAEHRRFLPVAARTGLHEQVDLEVPRIAEAGGCARR
jgi:hypothetical protein